MHTTRDWWNRVSNDPAEMANWLYDQYRGELAAAERIAALVDIHDLKGKEKRIIEVIAEQEAKHAVWVGELLTKRGLPLEVKETEERYWKKTLKEDMSFTYTCAVAHYAEQMRLSRINLLAQDDRFSDIADVFRRIRTEELFHAKAFKGMSTEEDLELARHNHEKGVEALGLVI